jgi:hypothetical protein
MDIQKEVQCPICLGTNVLWLCQLTFRFSASLYFAQFLCLQLKFIVATKSEICKCIQACKSSLPSENREMSAECVYVFSLKI